MGKKKEKSRNLFKEAADPRFSAVFTLNKNSSLSEKGSNISPTLVNNEIVKKDCTTGENAGFQKFISSKLAKYLDEHIKEVNRPVAENEFFVNKLESICLYSDSHPISEEQPPEQVEQKPPKKKRKKEKIDKGSFKDVAVTYEWLQKQAQMLKS